MPDRSFLDWPFFGPEHRALAERAEAWAAATLPGLVDHADVDGTCRKLVAAMGSAGFLDYAVPADGRFDVRSLCLLREIFARHDGLADDPERHHGGGAEDADAERHDRRAVHGSPAHRAASSSARSSAGRSAGLASWLCCRART